MLGHVFSARLGGFNEDEEQSLDLLNVLTYTRTSPVGVLVKPLGLSVCGKLKKGETK